MKKRMFLGIAATVLALLGAGAFLARHRPSVDFAAAAAANRPPSIRPDYSDTVIPPNIAPLNFLVEEPGTDYAVRIGAARGRAIELRSRNAHVVIPMTRWRQLLEANRGQDLSIDVCVRGEDGRWTRFDPIVNAIADDAIDNYLFYRLIRPIHTVYVDVNIYQRDLRTYAESLVVSNRSFGGGCVNCHTLAPNHPGRMVLQTRGVKDGVSYNGMIVIRDGEVKKIDTRTLVRPGESDRGRIGKAMAAYSAWHPNGQIVAFSANDIFQFFHAVGEVRDVFDRESDLALYHADADTVTTTPDISMPDRLETFPAWSPDGRFLYFSSAEPRPQSQHKEVRYDLMRIGYDAATGRWGDLETVLPSKQTGLSITEPRVSPDGRWLLCCMSEYGAFPVYQPSSDLYLLDLETREYRRLEINSPRCDSWHCWSANGRWIAFASKRRDGLFARVYFSHVDESGRVSKPVLLPQKDPSFYDRFLKTYNVPELATAPAPASSRALGRAIRAPSDGSSRGATWQPPPTGKLQ